MYSFRGNWQLSYVCANYTITAKKGTWGEKVWFLPTKIPATNAQLNMLKSPGRSHGIRVLAVRKLFISFFDVHLFPSRENIT